MTRFAKCPHCRKPVVLRVGVDKYESIWWLTHLDAVKAERKKKAEKTIAQLDRDGLLPKEFRRK